MDEEEIGGHIVDAALQVHRELGCGLLETVYEVVLAKELRDRGLKIKRQVPISISYKDIKFTEGFRADIVVEDKVILEIKSTEGSAKAHKKQLLTYLRLSGIKLGFLLNFGEELMRNGIARMVSGLNEPSIAGSGEKTK